MRSKLKKNSSTRVRPNKDRGKETTPKNKKITSEILLQRKSLQMESQRKTKASGVISPK